MVRAIEPDAQFPTASKFRVYRFQVETPYKGLPQNAAEVVVNPGNSTSCQAEYRRGVRYLIFASRLAGTNQALSAACQGSRIADDAGDDLRFLEAYRRNQATNSVYGRVLQWVTEIGRPRREEDASVAGADVVLSNGVRTFTKWTTETGDFRFEGIPAGAYNLAAHLAPYISNPTALPIEVPAIGCVERFPRLEARASLSGVLTTEDGHLAAKERVELLRRNQKGSWYFTYQFWTQTDAQGRFKFEDLPDGDYLLGYEIWSDKPSSYSSYATRYFPGAPERAHASIVHLMPMQDLNDLKFSLARPHTPRSIRVEVVWPNGTSPKQNLLQLIDGDELIKNVGLSLRGQPGATHNGIVEFTGYAEREYNLHVRYWIDDLGGPVPHDQQRIARSDKVQLRPGKEPATVRIVLTRTLLSDEDR
jgi:hypothetical protein